MRKIKRFCYAEAYSVPMNTLLRKIGYIYYHDLNMLYDIACVHASKTLGNEVTSCAAINLGGV